MRPGSRAADAQGVFLLSNCAGHERRPIPASEEAKTLTPTLRVFWMDARNDQKEVILDSFGH